MAFGSIGESGEDAPMSDINVTPLVDVMLVLLIVFMITMPVLTHSVQINLPVTNNEKQEDEIKELKPVEISIDEHGHYVLGADSTEELDLDTIKQKLSYIAEQDPQTIIAIDADKKVEYDHVVKLLDVTREVGLSKVGFRMEVQN